MTILGSARAASLMAAAALLSAAPAAAQPIFEPPLEEPTRLSEPVSFSLQAGTRSDCVVITVSEVPGVGEERTENRRSIDVRADGDGLRVAVIEEGEEPTDASVRIDAAGAISLEPGGLIMGRRDFAPDEDVLNGLIALVTELSLHGETFAQGDVAQDASDLQLMFALSSDPLMRNLDIEGDYRLIGESLADGAPVYVFEGDFSVLGLAPGYTMRLQGRDAYDANTGLAVYSRYVGRVIDPNGVELPDLTSDLEMLCGFAGS